MLTRAVIEKDQPLIRPFLPDPRDTIILCVCICACRIYIKSNYNFSFVCDQMITVKLSKTLFATIYKMFVINR